MFAPPFLSVVLRCPACPVVCTRALSLTLLSRVTSPRPSVAGVYQETLADVEAIIRKVVAEFDVVIMNTDNQEHPQFHKRLEAYAHLLATLTDELVDAINSRDYTSTAGLRFCKCDNCGNFNVRQ